MTNPLQRLRAEAGMLSTADYLGTLPIVQRDKWRVDLLVQLRGEPRPTKTEALSMHYLIQYIDHRDPAGPPPRV